MTDPTGMTADALVREWSPTIASLARTMAKPTGGSVQPDDLWTAGAMGLLGAAKRFDPHRGSFIGFAMRRIRGAMLDELREHDHLERRQRAKVGDKDSIGAPPVSLNRPGIEHAVLQLKSQASVFDEAARRETLRRIAALLERLTVQERRTLALYYGERLRMREIAKILGVSEPRISQLHAAAVRKLRLMLENK